MRTDEVPQDGLPYRQRDTLKKVMYAVGKDGRYEGVNSVGWEAENIALRDAWAGVEEDLQETAAQIKAGILSPLAWHMKMHLMDVALLAKYAGRWKRTVRRHLLQKNFARLSEKALNGYARVFGITAAELTAPVPDVQAADKK